MDAIGARHIERFREVVEQAEGARLIIGVARDEAGVSSLVASSVDANGHALRLVTGAGDDLASGKAALERLFDGSEAAHAEVLRAVTTSAGVVTKYWHYDIAQIRRFAPQRGLEMVRLALGETSQGDPTAVMLGFDAARARCLLLQIRGYHAHPTASRMTSPTPPPRDAPASDGHGDFAVCWLRLATLTSVAQLAAWL